MLRHSCRVGKAATILAIGCLGDRLPPKSVATRKRDIAEALRTVATQLGNTPAVCRKSYVPPGVLESYLAGELQVARSRKRTSGLAVIEAAGLATLRRLAKQVA